MSDETLGRIIKMAVCIVFMTPVVIAFFLLSAGAYSKFQGAMGRPLSDEWFPYAALFQASAWIAIGSVRKWFA